MLRVLVRKPTTLAKPNSRQYTQHMSLKLRLDEFAHRQFDDPQYPGTRITTLDKAAFMAKVNSLCGSAQLVDGYAPFCKHVFVPNWDETIHVGTVPITAENEHLLKSGYAARTEKELPVLERWFPKESVEIPSAKYLDLILYSKAQIIEECKATGAFTPDEDYDWGIISVKGQLEEFETPMSPITMLRNALGKEEGGSGVPLDREKYMQSVTYWKTHANIK